MVATAIVLAGADDRKDVFCAMTRNVLRWASRKRCIFVDVVVLGRRKCSYFQFDFDWMAGVNTPENEYLHGYSSSGSGD